MNIIIPPHQRLKLALESLGSYDAPDAAPSSLDQFDDETCDLDQLLAFLVAAISAARDIQRTRAMDREDLLSHLRERAHEEGLTKEEIHGVSGQFH